MGTNPHQKLADERTAELFLLQGSIKVLVSNCVFMKAKGKKAQYILNNAAQAIWSNQRFTREDRKKISLLVQSDKSYSPFGYCFHLLDTKEALLLLLLLLLSHFSRV